MPGGPADPQLVTWRQAAGPAAAYRTRKLTLATAAAGTLLTLWGRVASGQLADDDLAMLGATVISGANLQATVLADLYLAHILTRPPIGLTRPEETDRLQLAVRTAASDEGTNPRDALERLGRAEPLTAGQTAVTAGMREHKVTGWTRVAGATPCRMCAALANGRVLSPDIEMATHPGCDCAQEVVGG